MPKKYDYSGWSKEDLIKRIHELEKRKKYGLVWDEEREPEKVVLQCKKELPVLKEVKEKEIKNDPNKPTHILIEGDNYHALSVLNYTHENSIDVIYIDPPYNTGKKDFKYNDRIIDDKDGYKHSKWISFIHKRLSLAKNLLKDDGTIFISIDDNELPRLLLICEDIFGERNFIANIIWKKRAAPPNDKMIGTTHEYIVLFAKDISKVHLCRKKRTKQQLSRYKNPDNHPKGPWAPDNLMANVKGGRYVESLYFPIINPNTGEKHYPSSHGNWRFNKEKIEELINNNEIYFGKDGKGRPKLKRFLCDVREGIPFSTDWDYLPFNNAATSEIKNLFGTVNIFDTPKPTGLIKEILQLSTSDKKNAVILDFFAGSATTLHATILQNEEDGGNRQVIICNDNENNIITEIAYPRISKISNHDNLKYYKTDFVPAKATDENKEKLTKQSVEMLCLREDTFDPVLEEEAIKIFQNKEKYTAILFDQLTIPKLKEIIKKYDKPVHVYIFSLGDDDFADEFSDMAKKVTVKSIPAAILRVYRRIFK